MLAYHLTLTSVGGRRGLVIGGLVEIASRYQCANIDVMREQLQPDEFGKQSHTVGELLLVVFVSLFLYKSSVCLNTMVITKFCVIVYFPALKVLEELFKNS